MQAEKTFINLFLVFKMPTDNFKFTQDLLGRFYNKIIHQSAPSCIEDIIEEIENISLNRQRKKLHYCVAHFRFSK